MKNKINLKILFLHAIDVHIYQYLPKEYKIKTYTGDSKYEIALRNNFRLDQFIQNYLNYQKDFFSHLKVKKVNSKVLNAFDLCVLYKLADSLLKTYFKLIELNPHLSIDKLANELNTNIFTEDIELEILLFGRGYEQKIIELELERTTLNKQRSKTQSDKTPKNEMAYLKIIKMMDSTGINLKRAADAVSDLLQRSKEIKSDKSLSYQTRLPIWAETQIKKNKTNKSKAIKFFDLHKPAKLKSLSKYLNQETRLS